MMKIVRFLAFFPVLLLPLSCAVITDADRQLVREILKDSSGCVYIQGSGGGGASAVPVLPGGGGFGQGSLSAARSGKGAAAKCSSTGAEVAQDKE